MKNQEDLRINITVARLLKEAGIRQIDLTNELEIGKSVISQWLLGKARISSITRLAKIAELISSKVGKRITVDEIIHGTNEDREKLEKILPIFQKYEFQIAHVALAVKHGQCDMFMSKEEANEILEKQKEHQKLIEKEVAA